VEVLIQKNQRKLMHRQLGKETMEARALMEMHNEQQIDTCSTAERLSASSSCELQ
jgi:hypothetical protein